MRAYGNSRGDVVLLALAYGRNQRQEVKIHRPDVCYTAQGFQLVERSSVALPVQGTHGAQVSGMRMLVKAPGRVEAVSYWIRIGDVFTDNAWSIRYHIFQPGHGGARGGWCARARVADRAGAGCEGRSPDAASAERYRVQEAFLSDLGSRAAGSRSSPSVGLNTDECRSRAPTEAGAGHRYAPGRQSRDGRAADAAVRSAGALARRRDVRAGGGGECAHRYCDSAGGTGLRERAVDARIARAGGVSRRAG